MIKINDKFKEADKDNFKNYVAEMLRLIINQVRSLGRTHKCVVVSSCVAVLG